MKITSLETYFLAAPLAQPVRVSNSTIAQVSDASPAELLHSASTHSIVVRMLNNLKNVYVHREDHGRSVRIIQRLRQLLPRDVTLHRDLGICLMGAAQPGQERQQRREAILGMICQAAM